MPTIPINVLMHVIGQFPLADLLPFTQSQADRAELTTYAQNHLINNVPNPANSGASNHTNQKRIAA